MGAQADLDVLKPSHPRCIIGLLAHAVPRNGAFLCVCVHVESPDAHFSSAQKPNNPVEMISIRVRDQKVIQARYFGGVQEMQKQTATACVDGRDYAVVLHNGGVSMANV